MKTKKQVTRLKSGTGVAPTEARMKAPKAAPTEGRPGAASRVAFMTGASDRVGKAIALALAEQGYTVCFTYHSNRPKALDTLREIRRLSPASAVVPCDVRRVGSIQKAFRFLTAHFTRLDVVIALASNFYPTPLPAVSERDWDSLVDTNLKGTFFTMQSAAEIMNKQSFTSRLIAFSDVAAELVWRKYAPYTVSKLGIAHLVKIFAKEFAPKILVNAIAPGTVLFNPKNDAKHAAEILKKIPMGRIGTPEDIVKAVLFLAQADYITGETISIDGGRRLY